MVRSKQRNLLFDIRGNTFSTYVESGNGWVLIASGSASRNESSYATSTMLTLQAGQLLPSSIYTSNLITEVRMNATSGPGLPFDVQSSDPDVLANLQMDRTLSVATNIGDWTGTGTSALRRSCNSRSFSLSTNIYHACGNTSGIHWQVGRFQEHEKLIFSNSTKNNLNLWVRAAPVVLPVSLLNFEGEIKRDKLVYLDWQVASETNNDNYTIERSADGIIWSEILRVAGASSSTSQMTYSAVDRAPFKGMYYYRFKQTDFDGRFEYLQTLSIENKEIDFQFYPNPVVDRLNIIASGVELKEISIYNLSGNKIDLPSRNWSRTQGDLAIDLSSLKSGIYYIQIGSKFHKLYKK